MIKTLEALIAATVILISVVILFPPTIISQTQIPSAAYNCLRDMDDKGFLRYYAENNLTSELENKLKSCIPQNLDYSVKICDSSTCNPDSLPSKEITLVSYLIAGDQNPANRLINLWVWFR